MQANADIPVFEPHAEMNSIKKGLDEAGCAIILNAQSLASTQQVRDELFDSMDLTYLQDQDSPEEFYPAKTRRLPALLARSESVQGMATDPTINALCEHHLSDNCDRFQLHVSVAVNIGPGAREQVLHREEDAFPFFELPRPNLVIATMWAMNDFTHSNGATLLVPGSHRWSADRQARPDEVAQADMPGHCTLRALTVPTNGATALFFRTPSVGCVRRKTNTSTCRPLSRRTCPTKSESWWATRCTVR